MTALPRPSSALHDGWCACGGGGALTQAGVSSTVVSMGSADHQFNLVEILSQNYGIRQECDPAAGDPGKPEGELGKDFISQVLGGAGPFSPVVGGAPGQGHVSSLGRISLEAQMSQGQVLSTHVFATRQALC